MIQYAIYKNPRDFPGKIVVRRGTITPGGFTADPAPLFVGDDLAAARAAIPEPEGLALVPRLPEDDPAIVEVWI